MNSQWPRFISRHQGTKPSSPWLSLQLCPQNLGPRDWWIHLHPDSRDWQATERKLAVLMQGEEVLKLTVTRTQRRRQIGRGRKGQCPRRAPQTLNHWVRLQQVDETGNQCTAEARSPLVQGCIQDNESNWVKNTRRRGGKCQSRKAESLAQLLSSEQGSRQRFHTQPRGPGIGRSIQTSKPARSQTPTPPLLALCADP